MLAFRSGSNPVVDADHPGAFGAMSATVHLIPGLNAVADDFAAAVVAFGSKLMDGALEAVEIVGLPLVNHFDSLVVFVAANFTFHNSTSPQHPQPGASHPKNPL